MERTFVIIKPDGVERNLQAQITEMITGAGLKIVEQKQIRITMEQAEALYAIHKERPFYQELVDFITSGDVVVMILEADDAIKKWRDLMGATDPKDAAEGTIRKKFSESIGKNTVHGSDSTESYQLESSIFFENA